jgi:hypothetical protein
MNSSKRCKSEATDPSTASDEPADQRVGQISLCGSQHSRLLTGRSNR